MEPTTAVRQAEVAAAKTMIERGARRPGSVTGATDHWDRLRFCWDAELAGEWPRDRAAHPGVRRVQRTDDTFSREDFVDDHASDTYRGW